MEMVNTMSADAIRGYVRTLRQLTKKSQGDVAEAMHMALRTYKAWELGGTKDIKAPYLDAPPGEGGALGGASC